MAASLAQGEVPCDLEMAMGKYIYIYILLYTQIFSCTWLWGEYTGYGKYIHIAIYYLNDKPDFRGSQGVRPLVSPIGTSSFL